MTLKQQLLAAATTYSTATGRSLARLSTVVVNDGNFFVRLQKSNGDCTTATYEKFMAWLRANWPAGVAMPEAVHRAQARCAADADKSGLNE